MLKRNELLMSLYDFLGESSLINEVVRKIYILIVIPLIFRYLKLKHTNLKQIEIRNSIRGEGFHFLLSDIDTSLIVNNLTGVSELIKDFLKIKKVLIFLDFPEIYTVDEHSEMMRLKKSSEYKFVNLFWNIRKINWSILKMSDTVGRYEHFKLNRSINRSMDIVFKTTVDRSRRIFHLQDLNYIEELISDSKDEKYICIYSDFFENNNDVGISFELSNQEYCLFNYLYPGDTSLDDSELNFKNNDRVVKVKSAMNTFERLIILSSIRLRRVRSCDIDKHVAFLEHLEKIKKAEV